MKTQTIVFTKPNTAELIWQDTVPVTGDLVAVRTEYTVVSAGTERDAIMDSVNTSRVFPRSLGYCGVGRVTEVGEQVTNFKPGDRVLIYHGIHTAHNVVPQGRLTKVEDESLDSLDVAFVILASMGLGGVRKLELELGESAMVMGLGLLRMFALQFCRLSGACPVIAADPNPQRRAIAVELGADYALDPLEETFAEQVKALTGGKGVNACVEVTGASRAMKQALECSARQGRISLLGCTRISDCAVDYYSQVHKPGIKLIGAHNSVRPQMESYPHHWTHQDDCKAILRMLSAGRLCIKPVISRVVLPESAPQIYEQLRKDPEFPLGTVFDWR